MVEKSVIATRDKPAKLKENVKSFDFQNKNAQFTFAFHDLNNKALAESTELIDFSDGKLKLVYVARTDKLGNESYKLRTSLLLNRNIEELDLTWTYFMQWTSESGSDESCKHTLRNFKFSKSVNFYEETIDKPLGSTLCRKTGIGMMLSAFYTVKMKDANSDTKFISNVRNPEIKVKRQATRRRQIGLSATIDNENVI